MRIAEIIQLNERISFSEYQTPVLRAIRDGILETVYSMVDDFKSEDFDPLKDIDVYKFQGSFWSVLESVLKGYFEIHLKRNLEDTLSKVARNIVGVGSPGRWVNVVFKNTKSNRGWAENDNTIGLSETYYLDKLIVKLLENIQSIIIDNYSSETALETLKKFISKTPTSTYNQAAFVIGGRRDDAKLINEMTGTVLHELVHIKQQIEQYKIGRDRAEYRSYLQKSPEEFSKAYDEENSPLWYRLHASSPQEISAHVHNITLDIIDDFGFNDISDSSELENVDADTISNYVSDFLINLIGKPKTSKEKMVFKRYLKGVYQEVISYQQKLFNKLKQREQQDRKLKTEPVGAQSGIKNNIKSRLGLHTRPKLPKE